MRVLTEAKHNEILKIASQVFIEMGYEGASMAEIATRVGGSRGTLYRYFPSKERLFLEVVLSKAGVTWSRCLSTSSKARATSPWRCSAMVKNSCPSFAIPSRWLRSEWSLPKRDAQTSASVSIRRVPRPGWISWQSTCLPRWMKGFCAAADAGIAADHLVALVQAEIMPRCLMGLQGTVTRGQIKQVVKRAVAVFLAAYAV
jgi:AcrR family transcriptional regulator